MGEREKLLNDLWLDMIPKLPPQMKRKLAERFGGSGRLREAGAAEADEICRFCTGMSLREHPQREKWKVIFDPSLAAAEKQLEEMEKTGVGALTADDREYPPLLLQIADPPWMLYYRGRISCLKKTAVSIVGARDSTEYGRWAAREIAEKLARAGFLVVSGMAMGIDTEAHRGALAVLGEDCVTAAVFGCGPDVCYPRNNRNMMERILRRGVILSEYPPGTQPRAYRFPQRNRIISGLSQQTVIVEAGLKSGSLITAGLAGEQGRDVYAVPGNINRLASAGTNQLIRDGAIPLTSPEDILTDLGVSMKKITEPTQNLLGSDEKKIYNEILRRGEAGLSELAQSLSFSAEQTAALVTVLEMKGILRTGLGKIFIAKY